MAASRHLSLLAEEAPQVQRSLREILRELEWPRTNRGILMVIRAIKSSCWRLEGFVLERQRRVRDPYEDAY